MEKDIYKNISPLKNRILKDLFFLKIPKLLWFVDRASMASGIECRVPFLDRRLIEHCFSLPSNLLIKKGINKSIIKNYLKKRFKQKDVRNEKLYVATPQREWIKNKLKKEILEYVKKGYLVNEKIINYKIFKKHYDNYSKSSELGNSFKFWKIINAEIFCQTFF
jgi:asparagine synthase (glutamine-hydrolysing)